MGESFVVYSVITVLDMKRSCSYVIVVLDTELLCLGYWGMTTGVYFAVYSIVIGSEPERLSSSVIVSLDP